MDSSTSSPVSVSSTGESKVSAEPVTPSPAAPPSTKGVASSGGDSSAPRRKARRRGRPSRYHRASAGRSSRLTSPRFGKKGRPPLSTRMLLRVSNAFARPCMISGRARASGT